ncbi:hypothetical protein [Xenophilus sp. Marseille-Q4582]|uniref:hypothetical protein n=1 Tax=Xenophilus sp. Marseille-Q4582 TaxID=2866600 RepID=UPI001CE472C8|nr:hypothetical protein [Xenophilus sp. Marseille-Q4582]
MPSSLLALLAGAALLSPALALADPHDPGHGQRGQGHRAHKEVYWDGPCKVERKWKKDGAYKEERKCKGPAPGYGGPAPVPVYAPPAYGPAPDPGGLVIQGTVRLR